MFTINPDQFDTARAWSSAEKSARQCESDSCQTIGSLTSRQLEWAHKAGTTPHKTRSGKRVLPTDMLKAGGSKWGARYAKATILADVEKCRVLCANCHALETESGE